MGASQGRGDDARRRARRDDLDRATGLTPAGGCCCRADIGPTANRGRCFVGSVFHDPPTRRNRVWQTDFSEFETPTGGIWRISAVIDYVTKYCLAADLAAISAPTRETSLVQRTCRIQWRDAEAEYLGVVVMRNEHSVNLSLHGRTDLVIAGEGEVPVIAGEQQRNAVVGKQRVHVDLVSPACPEDVEVLVEPLAHLGFIHGDAPYWRDVSAHSAVARPVRRGYVVNDSDSAASHPTTAARP